MEVFNQALNTIKDYFYPQETQNLTPYINQSPPNQSPLGLPTEVFFKILGSLNSFEVLGRCARLDRSFHALIMKNSGDPLWRSVAEIKNIALPIVVVSTSKPSELVTQQIKNVFSLYHNAVITLQTEDKPYRPPIKFGFMSQKDIEAQGAICLTPNQDKSSSEGSFYGIIMTSKKTDGEVKWFLWLIPVIFVPFTEKDYDRLMPIVIEKLRDLKIVPNYVINYKEDPGPYKGYAEATCQNFQKWQKKQKKI